MSAQLFRNLKVLEVTDDYFIGAKGYSIVKYTFASKKYERVGKVADKKYSLLSCFSLTRRFFRAEINNIYNLHNGDSLLIAKKAIFRCEAGEKVFKKCFVIPRGSRPLNLCITPNGEVYFGEYFANMSKDAVNVYCSKDGGKSWNVVFTFAEGNINHIHGIFYDDYTARIWAVTGDRENECIIGYTEDGFASFVEVFRGGQDYRTCNLFFYPTFIVFATDSQYMVNEIRVFDRESLAIKSLQSIQGTAIKGGQYGNLSYLSTTVEPSDVNKDTYSHLWISRDGLKWEEIYKAPKDCLPAIMQFGSIEFPRHTTDKYIMFSGRALKKIDGCSIIMDL